MVQCLQTRCPRQASEPYIFMDMIQSSARQNNTGVRTHPCRTPDEVLNAFDSFLPTQNLWCCTGVQILDQLNKELRSYSSIKCFSCQVRLVCNCCKRFAPRLEPFCWKATDYLDTVNSLECTDLSERDILTITFTCQMTSVTPNKTNITIKTA